MEQDFLNLPADLLPADPADRSIYREAYQAGYTRTLRELEWARQQGWHPTERQIVLALMQAMRVYSAVRSGKPMYASVHRPISTASSPAAVQAATCASPRHSRNMSPR